MERAILVGIDGSLDELRELATAAGALVLDEVIQHRDHADPATFVGKGKADELKDLVSALGADLVIFDDELSPRQTRNLELLLDIKVVDRAGLILDIFSSRARTREGKLQVELAQLSYHLSRLTGDGGSLSRLGGGIGTRGPGETKLEVDRRSIRARIRKLKAETDQVRKHRQLHRDRRKRTRSLTVSLVGYTNAGKSTLFARLSGQDTLISRRVFATLDPLVRRVGLAEGADILISDTVGFIRKLPHDLVDAFRATLEEVVAADLILHVVDVSDPKHAERIRVVEEVLRDLGCGDHSQLRVYNKADRAELLPDLGPDAVVVSALHGNGMDVLKERILRHIPAIPA